MLAYVVKPGALDAILDGTRVEVARLSPARVRLHARGAAPRVDQRLPLRLGELTLALRIVAVARAEGGLELDGELDGLDLDGARDLARLCERLLERRIARQPEPQIVEREVVRAPARLREMLHALFANRCHARLHRLDERARWSRLTQARIEPDSDLPLQWECEDDWPEPPFRITVDGYMSLVEWRVEAAREVDGLLAVPVPDSLTRVRSRWERRVPAPPDVWISFRHPRWPELRVRRAVRNVSADGLLFSCSAVKDLVYPGLELADATLTWRDRLLCPVRGTVRHVSDDIDGEAQLSGLALRLDSPDDRAHFLEEVDRLLYPNTRMDGTWSAQLWDLYRSSGYLELSNKSEPEFVALREAFSTTGARIAKAGLGCQVVWPSSRGLEASISILRTYEKGAFIYQLARRPGRVPLRFPGRAILRDVYLHAMEHLGRMREVRWLVAWVQKEARFSRLVHVDFPARYVESGRVRIWRFRAMEGDATRAPAPLPPGLTIAPATRKETDQLLAMLQRTKTPHELEAHDLLPETFDQRQLQKRWTQGGFQRDRLLLCARRGGRAIAAALCESADDGLHLFRLLDVVRVWSLADGGEAAFAPLLEQARHFYRDKGKARFIYFLEGGDATHAAGLRDLGEADCVLLPSALFPELVEHLYEVTAPRDMPRLT